MMNKDFNEFKDQITGLWSKGDYHSMRSAVKKLENAYGKTNLKAVLNSYDYETLDDMLSELKQGIKSDWYDVQSSLEGDASEVARDIDGFHEVSQSAVEGMSAKLGQVRDLCKDQTPIWDTDKLNPLTSEQLAKVLSTLEANITSLAPLAKSISDVWDKEGGYQGAKVVNEAFDDTRDTNDYMNTFAYQCDIELGAQERADAIQYLAEPLHDNLSAVTGEDPDIQYNAKSVTDINRNLDHMLKEPAMFYLYPEIDENDEADLQKPKSMTKSDLLYLVYDLVYGKEITADTWLKNIKAINK